ncbi:hypothetical protein BC832DRAFT_536497 [Gaertneriomyces semiglobifer]|nr:hypothetical protein BC832DRAFT_536497 [Gaertneriomyces semiglobifer]
MFRPDAFRKASRPLLKVRYPIQRPRNHCSIWTTATSTAPGISTAIDQCLVSLRKSQAPLNGSPLCIFLVTSQYAERIDTVPAALRKHLGVETLLGTVVHSIDNTEGMSITLFDQNVQCLPFVVEESAIRRVRQKAVGRWPEFRRTAGQAEEFDLNQFRTISQGGGKALIPDALQKLAQETVLPSLLLTFSDREPHQFIDALGDAFPSVPKVGLIGAQTPFLTGRPHTLFYNERVLSGGLIGAAFTGMQFSAAEVMHPALRPVGEPLEITSCRGNVVLDIAGANATKELLAQLNGKSMAAGVAAERQLYARVFSGDMSAVYRVSGGDPSKGTLALDTIKDIEVGMKLQFLQRLNYERPPTIETSPFSIRFMVNDPDSFVSTASNESTANSHTIIAGSEDGFVYSQGIAGNVVEGSLVCDVPHAEVVINCQQS